MATKKELKERVFNKTGGICYYCGCKLDFGNFHMDHFLAKARNGKGGRNLVPACPDCNYYKKDLSIEEFRKKISNTLNSSIKGRMIVKYFCVEEKDIKFYFEEHQNGVL